MLIASTVPRGAQADRVVELAARADAHEQPRRDGSAGDAHLPGAGEPALVGDLAGRAQLGAEQLAQRLERVVLVGADAAPDADHDVGVGEHFEVVVARPRQHAHPARDGAVDARVDRGLFADRPRCVRGDHPGSHGRHLDRRGRADRGDELAAERGLPRDEPPVAHLEVDGVAGEARAEPGRDA